MSKQLLFGNNYPEVVCPCCSGTGIGNGTGLGGYVGLCFNCEGQKTQPGSTIRDSVILTRSELEELTGTKIIIEKDEALDITQH